MEGIELEQQGGAAEANFPLVFSSSLFITAGQE